MATIKIEGVPGLDGEYPLDLQHLTNRDMHTIKEVAGVAGMELNTAMEKGDLDIVVALAAIALRKSGTQFVIDQIWDAELGAITLETTEEEAEDDADPPALTPPVEDSDASGRPPSSGPSSNGFAETPAVEYPNRIGSQG